MANSSFYGQNNTPDQLLLGQEILADVTAMRDQVEADRGEVAGNKATVSAEKIIVIAARDATETAASAAQIALISVLEGADEASTSAALALDRKNGAETAKIAAEAARDVSISKASNAAISAANALASENAAAAIYASVAVYDPSLAMPKTGGTFTGNVVFQGNTTTINSTTLTLVDPIITLGSTSTATNDGKDRGIEFKYGNGTAVKTGFFGFDSSAGQFNLIADATNTNEIFSGAKATLAADLNGNAASATKLATSRTISLTGDVTGSIGFDGSGNVSIATTAAGKADLSGATFTGNVISPNFITTAGGSLIARGGAASAEGGQIILGWGNNQATSITGQQNATWNIDVASGVNQSALRVFAQDASGVTRTALTIEGTTGATTLASSVTQTAGTFAFGTSATLAAAGTTQGTATAITNTISIVTTGTGGVVFPASMPAGCALIVANNTAAAINVYPNSGGAIEALAANAPFSLGAKARLIFVSVSSSNWIALTATYG